MLRRSLLLAALLPALAFAQTTRVADGTGLPVNSLSSGAGQNALMVALTGTNFVISTGNSSTAQLASSATFNGTIETVWNAQTVSVLLISDQPGTLTLKQYITSSAGSIVSSWAYPVAAGVGFSRAFTANGNYFSLSFQNTGASTTTTLNINTAYGILPPSTNLGNVPVSINEVNGTALGSSNLPVAVQGANTTASGAISTACTTGQSCAGTSYVGVAMLGKQGAGAQVTASSSPVGVTLQCDVSMNGGTTWSEATAGSCTFDNAKTGVKSNTIAAFTVGDAYSLQGSMGVTNIRVRASALTSGTVTLSVTATDTLDPSELFGSPGGASSLPPAVAVIGAQDAVTSTTVNPINSAAPNTTPAAGARYLLEMPALGRAAVSATTAGNVVPLSVDTTNGGLNVRLMDSATYLSPQVAGTNALAAASAMAVLPFVARSAVAATTAGRSAAGAVDVTTGFQLGHISDGASYLKASVYANDTTAALNSLGVAPAIARAAPTATTAARAELLQIETTTGGLFVEQVPTVAAIGLTTTGAATVTASVSIKASAGNLYGFGVVNGAGAGCWLQCVNSATAGTLGTAVIFQAPIPTSGTVFVPPGTVPLGSFSSGIACGMASAVSGASACGTAATGVAIYYK